MIRRLVAFAAIPFVAIAVLGACGGAVSESRAAPDGSTSSTAPASSTGSGAGASRLPEAVVLDVASGAEVQLHDLAPAQTPLLLWFWAPH